MRKISVFLSGVLCLGVCLGADAIRDIPAKGSHTLALKKIWSVSELEGKPLGAFTQATPLPNGHVAVYDPQKRKNFLLDKQGHLLRSFASQGEGPGEVRRQHRLFVSADHILICDDSQIHDFSADGSFLTRFEHPFMRAPVAFFLSPQRFVSATQISFPGQDARGVLTFHDLGDGSSRELASFNVFQGSAVKDGERRMVMLVEFLTPMMMAATDGKSIFYGRNDRYEIHRCDLDGTSRGVWLLDRPNKPYSMEQKRQRFTNQRAGVSDAAHQQFLRQLPEVQTQFVRLQCWKGHLLVKITDGTRTDSQAYDLFTFEGQYRCRLVLQAPEGCEMTPPLGQNPLIDGDHVFMTLEDENGDIRLEVAEMLLPEGLLEE